MDVHNDLYRAQDRRPLTAHTRRYGWSEATSGPSIIAHIITGVPRGTLPHALAMVFGEWPPTEPSSCPGPDGPASAGATDGGAEVQRFDRRASANRQPRELPSPGSCSSSARRVAAWDVTARPHSAGATDGSCLLGTGRCPGRDQGRGRSRPLGRTRPARDRVDLAALCPANSRCLGRCQGTPGCRRRLPGRARRAASAAGPGTTSGRLEPALAPPPGPSAEPRASSRGCR